MMHGHEKSDCAIVAMKPPNKAGRPAAEAVERRAEAKENANRCHTCRTQCRESVSQVPERVRKAARPAVVGRGAPRPCSARYRRAGASQGLRQPMGSHADPLRAGREHRVRQASGRCRAIHMGRTVPVSKQDIQIIR